MGVSAVVVTYNRVSLLKQCLHHLLNQSYSLDKIFVVNNNSSDGTKKYLDNIYNKHIVVKNMKKNLGGAGGFSIGTKLAYENSNSKYFWIMDDDTMPTKNAVKALVSKAKLLNNNFGFLCSNVRWWKNREPCNIPTVTKDWTELVNKSLIKVSHATFVSVLVPRIRVQQQGLPIGEMFIWGDDTEYTTRLSSKHPSYFVSDSIVLHKSATNRSDETIFNASVGRILFFNYMYRNLIYVGRKYYPKKRQIRYILGFLSDLVEIPFKARNHKILRILNMSRSIVEGLFFKPKIRFPHSTK